MKGHHDSPTAPASNDGLTSLVTAVRWGTTTVGLLWAFALRSKGTDVGLGVLLLVYALFRTLWPLAYRGRGWRSLVAIVMELALCLLVIIFTGYWNSPYMFALFTPVIAGGFARGFGHALRIAIGGASTVAIAAAIFHGPGGIRPVTAWSGELALTAVVASYGRRLLHQAEDVDALHRQLRTLQQANSLLVDLERVTHDLPVSLDFDETVSTALLRVRELTHPDMIVLLLCDELASGWTLVMTEGARLPEHLTDAQLPAAVKPVIRGRLAQLVNLTEDRPGFTSSTRVGLYAPLWTGSRQLGLLGMEATATGQMGRSELELVRELADTLALTIDNARWFDRLRARGAAQERNRIARDIHDRVGQGVAAVAFELDRLYTQAQGTPLADDLDQLRRNSRTIVRELRETLYDLRTEVSDKQGLIDTIDEFLEQVSERSSIHTSFHHQANGRLPLAEEREVWRIAQEAIVNAERHADASEIVVRWEHDASGALLTVQDNGIGLSAPGGSATPGRPSYGITGMRERTNSLRAVLNIQSTKPTGTTVSLSLGNRKPIGARESSDQTPGARESSDQQRTRESSDQT